MAVTWDELVELDAGLALVPLGAQVQVLEDVYLLVGERWGALRDVGAKYLALHWAQLAKPGAGGGRGPVTSERLGDAALTYGYMPVASAYSDLETTGWGLRFKMLRSTQAPYAFVT